MNSMMHQLLIKFQIKILLESNMHNLISKKSLSLHQMKISFNNLKLWTKILFNTKQSKLLNIMPNMSIKMSNKVEECLILFLL